jgi:outer membrane immunogenic protein
MSKSSRILVKAIALVLVTSQSFAGGIKINTNNLDDFGRDAQYDWSGFYVGGSAIYTNQFRGTGQLSDDGYSELQPKGQGPKIGGYAGYNFQVNSFIIGAEADLSYGWNHDSRSMTGTIQGNPVPLYFKANQSASYSLRARLGYAFDNLMFFGTLGMASTKIKNSGAVISPVTTTDSLNNTIVTETLFYGLARGVENGYATGFGFEYGINNNWIARGEYIYSNYDRKGPSFYWNYRMGFQEHEIRSGLAYKF